MAVKVQREGATPNLLKYSVTADKEGGEVLLTREDLLRDGPNGPLNAYIARAVTLNITTDEDACRYLLCNPKMRVFATPQTLERIAVDAQMTGPSKTLALRIKAEPNARGIVALEFRHSLSA